MRYFFSVGEPSGDLHGSRLMAELRQRDPQANFAGFGGEKMQAAGCDLLYPLAESAVMGLGPVITGLPHFIRLVKQAKELFRTERPDAVVLIDYPGFNWHIAKAAKGMGIPVFYYVPPQIWSWATWRVNKMRRFVDHVLCALPFEEAWYHQRQVTSARYVGHPFFDDLTDRPLDLDFIERQRAQDGRRIVALLPGSRGMEVRNNFATMVRTAEKILRQAPDTRFLVAAFKFAHFPMMAKQLANSGLPIEVHVGRTPEIIRLAETAVSVSGSVSLELLYHTVPTAILYQINPIYYYILRPLFLRSPYITLVNLMAGRMLYPEFLGSRDLSTPLAQCVVDWLADDISRQRLVTSLDKLKRLYCAPGASTAAADAILTALGVSAPTAPVSSPPLLLKAS